MSRKRDQLVFLPEHTLLCIPGYELLIVGARDGYATISIRKTGRKLKGVKYETVIIDDVGKTPEP